MDKNHSLVEITRAFDSLRELLKHGRSLKGVDKSLFNDLGLSLSQAAVLAWLMNHKDSIYTIRQMSAELGIEDERLKKIMDDLSFYGLIETNGEDSDAKDDFIFRILDMQAMRACGSISSWSDYAEIEDRICGNNGKEEDEIASDAHYFRVPYFVSNLYGDAVEENELDDSLVFAFEESDEDNRDFMDDED